MPQGDPVRLNRYLALAGLGTRRSVERLIRSGRIAVGGEAVADPALAVAPGAQVTLDGQPLRVRGPCGVVVGLARPGRPPSLAHPAELHLAGESADGRLAVLLDDADMAERLRRNGFDPRKLDGVRPEAGAFRPLTPSEISSAQVFARRARR